MRSLSKRRALVTGGAAGIGRACTERLLKEGCDVAVCDIATGKVEDELRSLAGRQGRVEVITADLSSTQEVGRAVGTAVSAFGGIDILVNNVGVALKADILSITEDLFDKVMAVNLRAATFCTQGVAQAMIARKSKGVVINMSSVNGVLTIPDLLAYNLSKGAIDQLTRNTAVALAPYGIRVCGVGPGTIATDLMRGSVMNDPSATSRILARTPIGRFGEPEEIASIVAFLASDDASYITGDTIYADGGRLGLNYTIVPER